MVITFSMVSTNAEACVLGSWPFYVCVQDGGDCAPCSTPVCCRNTMKGLEFCGCVAIGAPNPCL